MSGDNADEDREEEALYKTYVQPLRVPVTRADPAPAPPAPERAAVAEPEPPPPEPPAKPESSAPSAADVPPPVARPAKDFEFRRMAHAKRRNRLLVRAGGAIVLAIAAALAYPVVHPFGSSSGPSLTKYLGQVRPLVQRSTADRKNVQAAVNAVRRNPKSAKSAERQLVRANSDRQALIRQMDTLGTPPRVARALPARFKSLLQGQIQTAKVWQRWMGRHPFVYLKNDAATRNGVESLLRSQQASKGAFARLYAQLIRAAGLPLAGGVGI